MNNCIKTKLKISLVFTALLFLCISNVYAQPANKPPFLKYLINNYSSLTKAACDTCIPLAGSPLVRYRPIPFPEAGLVKLATGVDVSSLPGLMSPNFYGGGSPEIKGFMKQIAGKDGNIANLVRGKELLYFNGAQGVAISKASGTIYTSAPTTTPTSQPVAMNGFFSFKSTPAILPTFNTNSDSQFVESPTTAKLYKNGESENLSNACTQTVYFAIDPNNEKITYASMVNPSDTTDRVLLRKSTDGVWYLLDWTVGGVLTGDVWGALAVDNDGNLYIADPRKNIIVKATFDDDGNASSWKILAGTVGTAGFKDDANGLKALFNRPSGICFDNNTGNIYVGDAGNNRVRKIDNDGKVTTYAGTGEAGFVDDNSAFDAKFNSPTAVAYNEKTKSLFVVDYNNNLIREIDEDQNVTTLAGNPGKYVTSDPTRAAMQFYYILAKLNFKTDEAKLDRPTGIAIDPSGDGLYVSDHNYIKYVSTFPTKFVLTSAFRELDSTQLPLPILPLGLSMDEDNGAFYGIPLMAWPATTYTISVFNSLSEKMGIANGFITIEVLACPEVPDSVTVNDTITPKQLPYTWNGQTFYNAGSASATLKTPNGCDSVVLMNLSVTPGFNYNSEPYLLSLGQQIKPIIPATAGSKVDTFSVSPALPAGLTLNAQTGVISGTPTVYIANQVSPVIGPKTPPQYPAPWPLKSIWGADITQVKISDGNQKPILENNSAFQSLQGSASSIPGTGTAGAYTDFSGLAAIKMYSNTPYSVHMSNALSSQYVLSLNDNFPQYNFMNSYAVYIDYNRDGDFADAGERVYISAAPQRDAHSEDFVLKIPATATAGVTKMRIYCVEASTAPSTYYFNTSLGQSTRVVRTTSQALSFYPFYDSISTNGASDFSTYQLNYGEFEDYNIDVVNPVTQSYVVTGSNQLGTAQSTINLAINKPSTSTTDTTICSTDLPYVWNELKILQGGTDTAHLTNIYGVDSAAILKLTVKQATSSVIEVANCGPYTYRGQVYTNSGDYAVHTTNAAGCDSSITFRFRQKATTSQTNLEVTPGQLPYKWNDLTFTTAGTQSAKLTNAEKCDSTATLTLRVLYNIYYPSNNLLTINKTISPITPQTEGGYQSGGGYSISPALPNGLQLNPNTGVISGLPTQISALQTYTITLNQDGAKPSTFTLSVGAPSVSTTTIDNCGPYTWNGVVYDSTGTATYLTKNLYGFDSTATLILTVRNPSTSTTTLLKNPSDLPIIWNGDTIRTEGLYTVHLYNAVNCDSAATVNVVVSPKISYTSPQILHQGQSIAAITPQNSGGKVVNYTILPALVKGLQFDAATGVITGTPTDTLLQPVTYTVTATNKAGTNSSTLVIGVCNPVATSFSIDTCVQYVWNDSTYTNSTTDTRTLKNRGGCDSIVTMHLNIKKASWGDTTTVTACSNYVWYGKTYDKTGIYTYIKQNAVGCDSTLTLNLTVNYPSVNNLYVNLNASDFPYTWRNKTFTTPGSDTVLLRNGNSVGCDSTVRMTVSISALLPDITYAVKDTILYWENTIQTPIAMTNTGTPIPALKLGERDTLVSFSNGPGDLIKAMKGPDGTYYAYVIGNSNVFKLNNAGVWTVFASFGGAVRTMATDKSGNLYVGLNTIPGQVRKITPDGTVSELPNLPYLSSINGLAVDPEKNLVIHTQVSENQIMITRLNLSTNQIVQTPMNNPYFSFGPEEFKTDSKGNIYMYRNVGSNLVKIKPDGHMSSIGQDGTGYQDPIVPGNGVDARISPIASIAIDSTNDNVYVMSNGRLLRVDTAENVTELTGPGRTFDQFKDQIFRVDNGKLSIVNSSSGILYTVNVYGIGSLPFMDNYGVSGVNDGTVNYKDFDKRIRLDSSGAIVGTPRAIYSSVGVRYADNRATSYTIVAANQHGISTAPMVITTKGIYYKMESFVTTSLPFIWRGRSFTAATDSATYYVANRLEADDTMYLLHLVYEGAPVPIVKATGICTAGGTTLTANGAAKNAIRFNGTNVGIIKNVQKGSGGFGYYNMNSYLKPGGIYGSNYSSSFEVWIKPDTVGGTQYLLTRDTVKTHGTFFGYSIQNGKFVYEFTKGRTAPFTDYKLSSVSSIVPNVWTHVAASYYDSTMYIFINGKLDATYQTPEGSYNIFYSETPGSTVGIFPDCSLAGLGNQLGYKGEMDELRLWSTRRNADSIQATMNYIIDPTTPALGLYYRFDGDVSKSASDVSSSGRSAMFVKPATSVPDTTAPVNFASYNWMPGGAVTKSIVVNPASKTLYTVTVTDYKKTSGSDSLSVLPFTAPGVTPPPSITKTNGPSSCSVVVSDAELGKATASDNCSVLPVQRTGVPVGNVFPVGVTTITYTATNAAGRTTTATQTVTITDNQKPVITSNGNQAVNNDKDVCGGTVKVSATATDNCSVGAPKGVRSDGLALSAVYPVGTTTITWNVSDANGNAALPVTQTVTVTDNQKPTVLTRNITVTLVNGTASITPSQIDAGSKDNCGIKTMSVSPSTFKCGDYGNRIVTLTVVDNNGNVGTKTATVNVKGATPSISITVSRTDKTYTGLDGKTIALGYGAQQLTLSASNTTCSTNATTYKWSPATGLSSTTTATTVFKPTAAGTYVFTVTATNEYGCTASATVTITVVDVQCGNPNNKVLVCHKTGSKSNPNTQLCISQNEVAAHLNCGDKLGMCTAAAIASSDMKMSAPTISAQADITGTEKELTVFASPNPTTNVFKLRITSNDQDTPATVRVLDNFGRSLDQFSKVAIGSTVTFGEGYLNGFYFAEVLQGTQRKVVKLVKAK